MTDAETRWVARGLRRKTTPTENLLWAALRRRQLGGLRFRRQHPVRGFVLDFYCPALRLAIEVDGDVHRVYEVGERDAARQEFLERFGLWFVRLEAADVSRRLPAVLRRIGDAIEARAAETTLRAGEIGPAEKSPMSGA